MIIRGKAPSRACNMSYMGRLPGSSEGSRDESSSLLSSPAAGDRLQRRSTSSALDESVLGASSSSSEGQPLTGQPSGSSKTPRAPSVPREWNLQQCLVSVDYWMLWLALFTGIGSGFTLLNNFGNTSLLAFLAHCHTEVR